MKVESGGSMTGFSWGFGINTAYLGIGFGRASYHLAGASNHVSIILRPDLLYRKFRKGNDTAQVPENIFPALLTNVLKFDYHTK
ncbi:MAG: hypothetical protein U0X39_09005 [Bacteroidales bacterium]